MRRIARAAGIFLVAAAAALPLSPARADLNGKNATAAWHEADQCAHAALLKFPDYTPASNARREVARRACLRDHRLPEPNPTAATQPAGGAK